MKVDVVTLFESMFEGPLTKSIVGRARDMGLLRLGFANPRRFASGPRQKVDDRPFGGGAGMVMMVEPLHAAIRSVARRSSRVIGLTAQGRRFDARTALRLSRQKHLVLVCGHYEGMDDRIAAEFDEEISIGDFILTGGELPAMMIIDAVTRLIPGVLASGSAVGDSFLTDPPLLEHPQYTRPRVWKRRKVPNVLLSGDHAKIAHWRAKASMDRTRRLRPDLLSTGGAASL